MDCSLPGSSLRGILLARILEWVALPSLGDLPNPGIEPASLMSPTLSGEFFTTSTTWETHKRQYLIQRQFLFTQDSINNPMEIADVADLLALRPMLQAFRNINI